MSQTSISQYGQPAFAGMMDGLVPKTVRSYAAQAAIPIGMPVRLGTNPEKQVLQANAGATAVGFAAHDHAREQNSAGLVQFGIGEAVNVLTAGRMWVQVADAVVAGAAANLVTASGLLTDNAVAAGIEAFTQIRVTFITATAGAGLALVEIK